MELLINSQASMVSLLNLGMATLINPTHYCECNYVSMLGLNLNRVSERAPAKILLVTFRWMHGTGNFGPRFNIKMTSFRYRKSHCGDKTILRPSYLHNGISYTGKTTSLYWVGVQVVTMLGNVVAHFSVQMECLKWPTKPRTIFYC